MDLNALMTGNNKKQPWYYLNTNVDVINTTTSKGGKVLSYESFLSLLNVSMGEFWQNNRLYNCLGQMNFALVLTT